MEQVIIDALNRFYAYTYTTDFVYKFIAVTLVICAFALWKDTTDRRKRKGIYGD